MSKGIVLILAMAVLIFLYLYGEAGTILASSLALLFPIFLIWFERDIAAFVGPTGKGWISYRFPSLIVRTLGWLSLVLIAAYSLFMSTQQS